MADKENATRRVSAWLLPAAALGCAWSFSHRPFRRCFLQSYASLQLQRKQAAAAADGAVPLPRVARVAAAGPVGRAGSAALQRSPLRDR